MLNLSRTTPVVVVHVNDPTADRAHGATMPDDRWLDASTQPDGCTRFRVRALNVEEYVEVASQSGGGVHLAAVRMGLLAIDDEPPPPAAELPGGHVIEIANLILALTNGPFGGRRS